MQKTLREKLPERHELKYLISNTDALQLALVLNNTLTLDEHADSLGEYQIRSLYFDDAYNRAYHEKEDGVANRDKYRIRIYNYSDKVIFLERKRKVGDLIQKSSVRISRALAEELMDGNAAALTGTQHPLLMDMYIEMRTKVLRPGVIVDYAREAYTHPAENTRITFDKRIRTGLMNKDLFDRYLLTVNVLDTDQTVMEVKFDRYMPEYIRNLISGVPAQRSAVSKYVMARRFEPLD